MANNTLKLLVTSRSSSVATWIQSNMPKDYSVDFKGRSDFLNNPTVDHYDTILLILPNDDLSQLQKSLSFYQNFEGKLIVCCSISAESIRAEQFTYSKNCKKFYDAVLAAKLQAENQNIYPVLFGSFDKPKRYGQKFVHPEDFRDVILNPANILSCYRVFEKEFKYYNSFEKLFGIKITAALFKYFTRYAYGYNL